MEISNKYTRAGWDNYYTGERKIHIKPKTGLFTSYDIYLCDYLIQKYIPKYSKREKNKPKIAEIGSGDGKLLKKIALMLGLDPIGIEYSKEAAKIAEKNGVKTIVSDAFDKKLSKKYKNHFDVVYSYGFIEHIIPPEKAVKIHLELLKPGGYFFIQIPRFKGFNLWKMKFFRPDLVSLHNFDVMNEDVLNKLCFLPNVEKIFCSNYGTLKLRIPINKRGLKYYLLKVICTLDYVLNPTMRILFKEKGFETSFFSPAVIFIGRKIK